MLAGGELNSLISNLLANKLELSAAAGKVRLELPFRNPIVFAREECIHGAGHEGIQDAPCHKVSEKGPALVRRARSSQIRES